VGQVWGREKKKCGKQEMSAKIETQRELTTENQAVSSF
jgi:hypothetical protein